MPDYTSHPATIILSQAHENRHVLGLIADKWPVLILTVVCVEPCRFNELKRRLNGITHKALTDALRRLERSGLILRRVLMTSPLGVEYSITELGKTLQEPCFAMASWVAEHAPSVIHAQQAFDKRDEPGLTGNPLID
jgi:DNA-binding HxlR family transcriptional regulator